MKLKAFVGVRNKDGKSVLGVTVYDETGAVVYSDVTHKIEENYKKFDLVLNSIIWATSLLKKKVENKKMDTNSISMFFNNKVVYGWVESESAPKEYISKLSELLLDFSLFPIDLELIHSSSALNKVRFNKSDDEELVSISDMFNSIED